MTQTNPKPLLDIRHDGPPEEWSEPADAEYIAESKKSIEISSDGSQVTIVGVDADGREVVLEYGLSKVLADLAVFDEPESEVTVTTAPKNTEWALVYPTESLTDPEYEITDSDEFDAKVVRHPVELPGTDTLALVDELIAPDSLILDGESATFPSNARDLWNRADEISVQEDYICVTGLDDSDDPIPKPYELYFILTRAAFTEDDTAFYTHPKREE